MLTYEGRKKGEIRQGSAKNGEMDRRQIGNKEKRQERKGLKRRARNVGNANLLILRDAIGS